MKYKKKESIINKLKAKSFSNEQVGKCEKKGRKMQNFKLFKVLNHRESKKVYIFDVKLYREAEGHRYTIAEGRTSVNISTGKGHCTVFGDYTPSDSELHFVVAECLKKARRLKEEVFEQE